MTRVIGRWLLTSIPVVFVVSVLTFILTSLVPGDAARTILGPDARPDEIANLRLELGLDLPLHLQYWKWLTGILTGDFGQSIATRGSVSQEILGRLPATTSLLVLGIIVTTVVGVGLGLLSAIKGGIAGKIVDVASLIGLAVPSFWLALVLVALLAVKWQLFPATGYVGITHSVPGWIASMFLPILTLAITGSAGLAKQTRTSVRDELGKEYVRMLRARGIPERRILLRHVLRNAAGPIITVIGLMFIGLVGGAVLLETVFVLPGLGMLMVEATRGHNISLILGITLILSIMVVIVNLIVEICYALLDPRVRR